MTVIFYRVEVEPRKQFRDLRGVGFLSQVELCDFQGWANDRALPVSGQRDYSLHWAGIGRNRHDIVPIIRRR